MRDVDQNLVKLNVISYAFLVVLLNRTHFHQINNLFQSINIFWFVTPRGQTRNNGFKSRNGFPEVLGGIKCINSQYWRLSVSLAIYPAVCEKIFGIENTPSAAYRMRCMMPYISVRKLLSSNIYQNMQSLLFNKLNFNIYFYDVAAPGGCPNSGSLARLFWQNGCSGVRSIRCIKNFGRFPGFGCEPAECGHFPIEWYRKKNLWQGVGGCFSRAE